MKSLLFFIGILFVSGCCCLQPDVDTGDTTGTLETSEITVDEIKTGRALVCEFKNPLDGWDFVYKTEYPKVRVEHDINYEGAKSKFTVMGDLEAIDWKGCTPPYDDCLDDPEFTEMYLLMEEMPASLHYNIKTGTWYLTPDFHDFGDFDIIQPEGLIWLIDLVERNPSSWNISMTCQWRNDITDLEFQLPAGVVPELPPG